MSEDELNRQRFQSEDNIIHLKRRTPEEAQFHMAVKAAESMKEIKELKERLARLEDALKTCDEEFDHLAMTGPDTLDYPRYAGLRSMIEEALKSS